MKTTVISKPGTTFSARVYRAETGEWEDLGVIVGPFHQRAANIVRRKLNSIIRRIKKWHM